MNRATTYRLAEKAAYARIQQEMSELKQDEKTYMPPLILVYVNGRGIEVPTYWIMRSIGARKTDECNYWLPPQEKADESNSGSQE